MSRVRHAPSIIIIVIAARIIWQQIQARRAASPSATAEGDGARERLRGVAVGAADALGRGAPIAKRVASDAVNAAKSARPLGSLTGAEETFAPREPTQPAVTPSASTSVMERSPSMAEPAPSLEAESTNPDPNPREATPDASSAAEAAIKKTRARPRRRGGPVPPGAVASDGSSDCPPDYPIKGNASSMIYHQPGQPSYNRTIPEYCFAHEDDARGAGYRPPKR